MPDRIVGPTSHWYYSERLRLHYADWGNESAPPLLLVHGGRDHCRNWDWLARALRDEYHILAPDLRGHGDSQWLVGAGYAMIDYVYDIAQLLHQKSNAAELAIIGHSMGGSIVLQYAGLYPERVRRVVSIEGFGIEGFGPSAETIRQRGERPVHERLREWITQGRELSARLPRRYPTLEAATLRMQEANPHLSHEQARHLTIHGTNQNEDGSYSWKFDNYVRRCSPHSHNRAEAYALWSRIECPVLLIRGDESWVGDPDADGRSAVFRNAQSVQIKNAGHWVHHDQLAEVLRVIRPHLAS
jgi:pimeloyl-ACP methyl ester carboxylesterase